MHQQSHGMITFSNTVIVFLAFGFEFRACIHGLSNIQETNGTFFQLEETMALVEGKDPIVKKKADSEIECTLICKRIVYCSTSVFNGESCNAYRYPESNVRSLTVSAKKSKLTSIMRIVKVRRSILILFSNLL